MGEAALHLNDVAFDIATKKSLANVTIKADDKAGQLMIISIKR